MKLKGFTILEMVMVMALMSIVIGIGYAAWNVLESNFSQYSTSSEKTMNDVNFMIFIKKDFNDAKRVEIKNDNLIFYLNDLILKYQFNSDKTIRNAFINEEIISGEFQIQNPSIEAFFQGQYSNDGIIDYCIISFMNGKIENSITLHKTYDSDELIRQQEYVN